VCTFVSPDDEERLRVIEKALAGTALPRVVLPNFDAGTHAHVPLPVKASGRPERPRRRSRSGGSSPRREG
jgi:hypothetical protein